MSPVRRRIGIAIQIVMASIILSGSGTQTALALTQHDLYTQRILWFNIAKDCSQDAAPVAGDTRTGSTSVGYNSTMPQGKEPEDQIWYFFTQEVGLSEAGTAGIMGNMKAESGWNPASHQTADAWDDMSSVYFKGVGLVQWDGGRRPAYIRYAQKHNADKKSIVPQLNYIWQELNSNYQSALSGLQSAADPVQAAIVFHAKYEISADSPERIRNTRGKAAQDVYDKYHGKTGGESGAAPATSDAACTSSNDASTQIGADCGTATGNARILCAAKKYDTTSYELSYRGGHQGAAQWHKECPKIGPSCYTDCSGLVNLAVYDVYKVELRENTTSERADIGKYWKKISYAELKPGDIMQPHSGHVEIVDTVKGSKFTTFGAHTSRYPQPRQVSPANYSQQSGQLYLRYIGPGGV